MILDEKLAAGDVIVLDGAIGSEIDRLGGKMDEAAWCGVANWTHPDTVRRVHESYLEAGADVITANTFATCRHVLEAAGYGLRHINEELKASGVEMDVMCCGGSPALSRLWCSIKASVLEVAVDVPERPEQLSAHGCALAAGAALEWWDGVGSDSMDSWPLPAMTRVEPTPDDAYRGGYERFVALGDAAASRLGVGAV